MGQKKHKRRGLQIVLVLIGGVFLLLYPIMQLWPSGWIWLPRQHEYEQMMIGVYATLGIFLIWASRRPEVHLSLIWFAFWSSLVHGTIMCIQAVLDPQEHGHLIGDVAALFIAVILLGWLTPRTGVKELSNLEPIEHTLRNKEKAR
jgi:FtsH-binding integral membrane protein